jgi:hypothetical protein
MILMNFEEDENNKTSFSLYNTTVDCLF